MTTRSLKNGQYKGMDPRAVAKALKIFNADPTAGFAYVGIQCGISETSAHNLYKKAGFPPRRPGPPKGGKPASNYTGAIYRHVNRPRTEAEIRMRNAMQGLKWPASAKHAE